MLCDIEANFHSDPLETHVVDGSLNLSATEEHHISEVKVEFTGVLTYICPTLATNSNFADPEKASYTYKECKFLSLRQTLESDVTKQDFQFDLPNGIQLSDSMHKRLSLARPRQYDPTLCYPLPPSFCNKRHSYLQTLFVPWKERANASVDYYVKVTVTWEAKPGVGRLLGSSRQKSFRKPVTVVPFSTSGVQTGLPRYSKLSGKHWQRRLCFDHDSLGEPCSVFVEPRAKLRLLGDTCLAVDRPLQFSLELHSKLQNLQQLQVRFQLVMIVSTKMRNLYCEVERRNSKILSNRLLVKASPEQARETLDASPDGYNCAQFSTSTGQLQGSLYLLEDPSTDSQLLPPPFTFAGLTIEYHLQVHISSPSLKNRIAFNTPTVILETDPQDCPPSYTSVFS